MGLALELVDDTDYKLLNTPQAKIVDVYRQVSAMRFALFIVIDKMALVI